MSDEMYSDYKKITISGAAKDEATSQAKESLYLSVDFNNASRIFKSCAFTLIEESKKNTNYIAKVATNAKVIEREDVDILQAVANRKSWLTADKSWAKGLSKEEVITRIFEDAKEYDDIMEILTADEILNREDATRIINTAFSFATSRESKKYAKKILLQEELSLNENFRATSSNFQESVLTLVASANQNLDYISKVTTNPNVIAREDYSLIEKVATANPMVTHNSISSMAEDEKREYLTSELNNFNYIMSALTEDCVLKQENATSILDTILACKNSGEAVTLVETILTELNNTIIADSMIVEATAPQVQDTTGFRK